MRTPWMIVIPVLVLSCAKPEPEERADYHLDNRTGHLLTVEMVPHWPTEASLEADSVPALQRVLIYKAVQGSGGHSLPSNFFQRFSLYAGDSLVYTGVRNDDWRREALQDGRHQLVLVIE